MDWQGLGIGTIEFASNGLEGYECALKTKPDLILSDISMPIMDGLDMAERIKDKLPNIKFIFMSCFDEKDYIMNAIDVNAYGYVVKPISIEKLTESVKKALRVTSIEKKKDEKLILLEREITEILPIIRENLARDLLYGSLTVQNETADRLLKIGLDLRGYYTVGAVKADAADAEVLTERDYLAVYKIKKIIESIPPPMDSRIRACCMIQNYKTLNILIYADEAKSIWDAQEQVIMFLVQCKETIYKEIDVKITISIGKISDCLNEISEIFKSVEASLDYEAASKTKGLILAEEIRGTNIIENCNIQELKDEIEGLIDGRDSREVATFVDKYFNISYSGAKGPMKRLLFTIISIIQMILYERNESFGSILNDELAVWKKALNTDTILDIRQWIINILKATIEFFESKENNYYIKIVERIKNIVDDEYAKIGNISYVTEKLYLSKNHANIIFKKYTGESIFDYMVKKRMQQAKLMLLDHKYKIGEISRATGYKSNAYFTSVFKEYTGITPKEYRYRNTPKN